VCTTACDERELLEAQSVHSAYYSRAAGNMGGGMIIMIVVVKCRSRGEAGKMLQEFQLYANCMITCQPIVDQLYDNVPTLWRCLRL
jgi:hypothetical protein